MSARRGLRFVASAGCADDEPRERRGSTVPDRYGCSWRVGEFALRRRLTAVVQERRGASHVSSWTGQNVQKNPPRPAALPPNCCVHGRDLNVGSTSTPDGRWQASPDMQRSLRLIAGAGCRFVSAERRARRRSSRWCYVAPEASVAPRAHRSIRRIFRTLAVTGD